MLLLLIILDVKLIVVWFEVVWVFIYMFWYMSILYEGEKFDYICKFIELKSIF